MTKRDPTVYKNYSSKRPQYPFRLPVESKDEIEELRVEMGLTKQGFMDVVFELGYPMLKKALAK